MEPRSRGLAFMAGVLLPLVLISSGSLHAGELSYVIELPLSELAVEIKDGYTLLSFEGAYYDAASGYPLIPFMMRRYLIPRGMKVSNVSLRALSVKTLYVERPLYPAQPPRPLSARVDFVEPVKEAYASRVALSDFDAQLLYEGLLEGEKIASIAVKPIRYTPAEGKLEVAEQMVVTIRYEPDPAYVGPAGITTAQQRKLSLRVQGIVDNPELLTPQLVSQPMADEEYRHAIVTPYLLRGSFEVLAEWNTRRGIRDTVVSLESIASTFPGRDIAEQIRNFVIFAHEEWGLEHLLLGGDEGLVPTRDCYLATYGGGSKDTIPTDMYFGCLDGDWDSDGDNVFGEMNDGVDLYAEVSVGRACVNDAEEANLFVGKIMIYQDNPAPGFVSKLLLPSEILWPDLGYSGDGTNDDIAAMSHPGTKIAKLYETQGTLSRQAVEDSLNAGVGLVHHCAHGNEVAISCADAAFYNWQAAELMNGDRMSVYVSIACNVGAFDYTGFGGCLVEAFQRAELGGTVAWVGNSRYGWGTPPSRGPSECLDVSFFGQVYDLDNPEIGPALASAKEENVGWGDRTFGRWCIYELNLHGDPAMSVHSREPSEFIVTYSEPVEGPQTFIVTVESEADYPVEGMLVCARQLPNAYAWAYTDAAGVADLDISLNPGLMELAVTGANHLTWYKEDIQVGERQAEIVVSPESSEIDAEVDPLSASFMILSTGTDTLRVTEIAAYQTTWISSVDPASCNLAPAESCEVGFSVDTAGLADGIYDGQIRILSNDSENPAAYHLVKLIKGDWPQMEITPDTVVFKIFEGDSLTKSVQVANEGRADLEVSSISSSTPWITRISPTSLSIPAGEGSGYETVWVTVDTTGLGFGNYEGSVIFQSNDPDESYYELPVLLAMGEPDITLSPDTLHFFFSWVDESRNKTCDTLVVGNEGEVTLEVTDVIPGKNWITVSEMAFDVEPSGSHDVHVTVHPEHLKQGVYDAYITVRSNDPDEPSVREPVRLLVEEAPPRISCKPDTAIMERETMRGTFWVHNIGMRDLVVRKISSEVPWIVLFFPKGFTVRSGDSAQVTMIGDPSKVGEGPVTGTVLIESNDTHNPEWKQPVKLTSGPGIAEALPEVFELSQVTPNPVSGKCLIRFAVPHEAAVSLSLYDVAGKKVRSFTEGLTRPGYYFVPWVGDDDLGRELPRGVYILRMESPEYRSVQKLVLLR